MARISTYPLDSNISRDDLLIGTDEQGGNITKNFSVGGIADFIIGTGTANTLSMFSTSGLIDSPISSAITGSGTNIIKASNVDRFVIDKPSGITSGDPEYLISQDDVWKASFGWDDDGDGFGYLYNWSGNGWRFGAAGNNPELTIVTTAGQEGVTIANNLSVEGNAGITGTLADSSANTGTAGQVLSSTVTGTAWVNSGTSASTAESIVQPIIADGALVKGDPVYITGFNNGQNKNIVAKADSSDPAKMPVIGISDGTYINNDAGSITAFGSFNGVFDTTGGAENWSVGDIIYVKPGGGLTNIKPGGTDLIQNIAIVSRVQQNTGELEVIALGRANDVPNPLVVNNALQRLGIRGNPERELDVFGGVRIRHTLDLFQGNNNSFAGQDAGNLFNIVAGSNTGFGKNSQAVNLSGSSNTSMGLDSLSALITGNNNTAIGASSMLLLNGGSQNVALGGNSLVSATAGNSNTAIGYAALLNKTTSNFNTAVGFNSLANITTGFRNTAVGNDAGKFTSDGTTANATGNNSVFIGDSAKAQANGQDNQIVIGDGAIGNGTNTATIGNTNITDTYLNGNVRIPGALVDSSGDAGTVGQVLSSAVTGTAWVDSQATNMGIVTSNLYATWTGVNKPLFNFTSGLNKIVPYDTININTNINGGVPYTYVNTSSTDSAFTILETGNYKISINAHFFDQFGDIDVVGGVYNNTTNVLLSGLIDQKDVTGNTDSNWFGQNVVNITAGTNIDIRLLFSGGSGQSPYPSDSGLLYNSILIERLN